MQYSREFLINAFLSRYIEMPVEAFMRLADMADKFFDEVGRDKFRVYCSLDADAIRVYKNRLADGSVF